MNAFKNAGMNTQQQKEFSDWCVEKQRKHWRMQRRLAIAQSVAFVVAVATGMLLLLHAFKVLR